MKKRGKQSRDLAGSGRARGAWIALGVILLVGLLLRAAYLREIYRAPDFDAPGVDAGFHDYWGRGLAFGDWTRRGPHRDPQINSTPYIRPPGYPYFLGLVYKLVGPGYLGPRVVQMALGLVNCVLAFLLARRWYGNGVGLVLAGFMAVYWIFIYYEGHFHEPVLLIFVLLSFANLVGLWADRLAPGYALGAGLLLGLAALIRPNALLLIPAVLLWGARVGYRRCGRRRLGRAGAGFLLGAAATIAPATIRNYVVAGEFVLISANAGINLLIGNHQNANGLFVRHIAGVGEFGTCYDYPRLIKGLEAELGRPVTYAQASSYFAGRALEFVRENPGRVARLTLKKAWLFWGPYEISHNKEVPYEREFSGVLGRIPGGFAWVAALFVLGLALWVGDRRRGKNLPAPPPAIEGQARVTVLVLLIVLIYFVSYLPFFNTALYRVPVIPFLLLFAAYGLVGVWRLVAARAWARAGTWAAVGLALYVLASRPFVPYAPDLAKWHFSRAAAYTRKRDHQPAIREYRQAIEMKPGFFEARLSLGWVLLEEGRLAEGIEHLSEALRLRPNSMEVHNRLANAYMKQGRVAQALVHYRAAVELDPDNAVLRTNLGVGLLQVRQVEQAAAQFAEALRIDPQDALAHASLGLALQQRGRLDEAVEHLVEAVRLDPSNARVRYEFGAALERAGRPEEAIAEYRRVLQLNPGHALARSRLEALSPGPGEPEEQ